MILYLGGVRVSAAQYHYIFKVMWRERVKIVVCVCITSLPQVRHIPSSRYQIFWWESEILGKPREHWHDLCSGLRHFFG